MLSVILKQHGVNNDSVEKQKGETANYSEKSYTFANHNISLK
jgi:hypothetical protein